MTERTIQNAIDRLGQGYIGVMLSDTVFGLMGRASDRDVVEKIYSIKKRNPSKPCIVLINDIDQLDDFHVEISGQFRKFLQKIWPGPVTVILRLDSEYVDRYAYLHRGTSELTFRLPNSSHVHRIIAETGPLVAPSANIEGEPPAQSIADVEEYFGDDVDVYVDKNDTPNSDQPSTIIKIKKEKMILIREGQVPFEEIESIWTALL